MSKKDFIGIGDMMRLTRPNIPDENFAERRFDHGRLAMWELHRDSLATFFADTYPKFDRERWLRYVNGGNA